MPTFDSVSPKPTTFVQRLWTTDNLLQVVGAGCGLWGNYLITQGEIAGFIVWIVSNVALVWLHIRTRLFALVLQQLAYLYLCFQGIAVWSEKSASTLPNWLPKWLIALSNWLA